MSESIRLVKGAGVKPAPRVGTKPLFDSSIQAFDEIFLSAQCGMREIAERKDEYRLSPPYGYRYDVFQRDLDSSISSWLADLRYKLPGPIAKMITKKLSRDKKKMLFLIRIYWEDLEGESITLTFMLDLSAPGHRGGDE